MEETLLIPPPDVVPMWGQMEDSGDCCGFIQTNKNVTNLRGARHGSKCKDGCRRGQLTKKSRSGVLLGMESLQLNKEMTQMRAMDQPPHLPS